MILDKTEAPLVDTVAAATFFPFDDFFAATAMVEKLAENTDEITVDALV